jgi:hypothetical protein
MTIWTIPLYPSAQSISIALSGTRYHMTFLYRDGPPDCCGGAGWVVDIADSQGNPLVCGVPLVTGADLLEQYAYLNFGGKLGVISDGDPTAVPTFNALGVTSRVVWVTTP